MPETMYTRSGDDAHVAYQVFGEGEEPLLLVWGFLSHVELIWDHPAAARFLERLGRFARVINFDKRGMGLSDPVPRPPTLEERVEDMLAVLDDLRVERATLFGFSEGAAAAILFAATHPDRTRQLVLYGAVPRSVEDDDYPWAAPADALLQANRELIAPLWGDGGILEIFAPSVADDPQARRHQARIERYAAPPGVVRDLFEMFLDIDVRNLLPVVRVPTLLLHRRGDRVVNIRGARWMASQMPNAELVEFEGIDHQLWVGDTASIVDEIERFVTGHRPAPEPDRVLRTVLFTDVVGSTQLASELGDQRWLGLLAQHEDSIHETVTAYGGEVVKTLGDGSLALFERPGLAISCAVKLHETLGDLGLQIRAGVHAGECELLDGDVGGIAVHIAARLLEHADAGETVASGTLRGLVVGSGIQFEDRGEHTLKGVPGTWRLCAVTDVSPADPSSDAH
ncbi:MAG: adenylate/guanylate cyclase domain-containing protein [Nitriliruptorales bacterium]|nr:adenylate/guanylate cyclase domain-containing protein [Nitriliruptorales bacterium]